MTFIRSPSWRRVILSLFCIGLLKTTDGNQFGVRQRASTFLPLSSISSSSSSSLSSTFKARSIETAANDIEQRSSDTGLDNHALSRPDQPQSSSSSLSIVTETAAAVAALAGVLYMRGGASGNWDDNDEDGRYRSSNSGYDDYYGNYNNNGDQGSGSNNNNSRGYYEDYDDRGSDYVSTQQE